MAKRAPVWTPEEFEILLSNPHLSDEELARKLKRRTPDAVTLVRTGAHYFHTGKKNQFLSKMMQERLARSTGRDICPICRENLN